MDTAKIQIILEISRTAKKTSPKAGGAFIK